MPAKSQLKNQKAKKVVKTPIKAAAKAGKPAAKVSSKAPPLKKSASDAVRREPVPAKNAKPVALVTVTKAAPRKAAMVPEVAPSAAPRKVAAKVKSHQMAPAPSNPEVVKAKAALKAEAAPKVVKKTRKELLEISAGEAVSALAAKWNTLFRKSQQLEVQPYNMKAVFEEKTAIMHKVLGWGYILTNRNDRLEVLFKDGIKYLISNYKP